MLPAGNIIKKTALTALKNKWLNVCIASCVLIFSFAVNLILTDILLSLISVFAVIFNILFLLFVNFPILYGTLRFFRRTVWGTEDSPAETLVCFKNKSLYKRSLLLGGFLYANIFLSFFIFMLPSALCRLLSNSEFYNRLGIMMPDFAPGLSIVAVLLNIAAVIFTVVVNFKYYLMPFLAVANETVPIKETVILSRRMSRATAPDFCWLCLSLFGWIILSLFIIPLVFTLPYFLACYIVFCRFCTAHYNKSVSSEQQTAPSFNPKY